MAAYLSWDHKWLVFVTNRSDSGRRQWRVQTCNRAWPCLTMLYNNQRKYFHTLRKFDGTLSLNKLYPPAIWFLDHRTFIDRQFGLNVCLIDSLIMWKRRKHQKLPSIVPHGLTPLTCLSESPHQPRRLRPPRLSSLNSGLCRIEPLSQPSAQTSCLIIGDTQALRITKNLDVYPIPKKLSDSCWNNEPCQDLQISPIPTPMVATIQQPSLSGAGIVAVLSCHYNLQLQPELIQFYEVQDNFSTSVVKL